jgi:hypothetical protein
MLAGNSTGPRYFLANPSQFIIYKIVPPIPGRYLGTGGVVCETGTAAEARREVRDTCRCVGTVQPLLGRYGEQNVTSYDKPTVIKRMIYAFDRPSR